MNKISTLNLPVSAYVIAELGDNDNRSYRVTIAAHGLKVTCEAGTEDKAIAKCEAEFRDLLGNNKPFTPTSPNWENSIESILTHSRDIYTWNEFMPVAY